MPSHRMFRGLVPVVAGCLLALTGCGDSDTFDQQHDGSSVEFDVGQQFFVNLTVDTEHGHSWDIESVKASIIKTVERTVEEATEEGANSTAAFTFECASAGTTQLLIVESDERGSLVGRFRLQVTCVAEDVDAEPAEEESK